MARGGGGSTGGGGRTGALREIRLAFLGMQGNGHFSTLPDWSGGWDGLRRAVHHTCNAGSCNGSIISHSNERFIRERLAPLQPDVVVFGPGPWMPTKGAAGMDRVRSFLKDVQAILKPRDGRAIFRTCPRGSVRAWGRRGCSNGAGCDEPFRRILSETGWELLDVYRITEALWAYVDDECAKGREPTKGNGRHKNPACSGAYHAAFADNVHFQCHVYREFNRQLLQLLRPKCESTLTGC